MEEEESYLDNEGEECSDIIEITLGCVKLIKRQNHYTGGTAIARMVLEEKGYNEDAMTKADFLCAVSKISAAIKLSRTKWRHKQDSHVVHRLKKPPVPRKVFDEISPSQRIRRSELFFETTRKQILSNMEKYDVDVPLEKVLGKLVQVMLPEKIKYVTIPEETVLGELVMMSTKKGKDLEKCVDRAKVSPGKHVARFIAPPASTPSSSTPTQSERSAILVEQPSSSQTESLSGMRFRQPIKCYSKHKETPPIIKAAKRRRISAEPIPSEADGSSEDVDMEDVEMEDSDNCIPHSKVRITYHDLYRMRERALKEGGRGSSTSGPYILQMYCDDNSLPGPHITFTQKERDKIYSKINRAYSAMAHDESDPNAPKILDAKDFIVVDVPGKRVVEEDKGHKEFRKRFEVLSGRQKRRRINDFVERIATTFDNMTEDIPIGDSELLCKVLMQSYPKKFRDLAKDRTN